MWEAVPSFSVHAKLYACAALVIAWYVADFVFSISTRWKLRHLPGPPPQPVLGNASELRKAGGLHLAHTAWSKQYGKAFRLLLGSTPVVVISDAEMVRQVGIKYFAKFHDRGARNAVQAMVSGKRLQVIESGLLTSRGARWASLRAAWQGQFTTANLEAYAGIMAKAADTFVENLAEPAASGEAFDITKPLGRMTLEVIGTTALGVHFNSQRALAAEGGDENDLLDACKQFFTQAAQQSKLGLLMLVLPRGLARMLRHVVMPFVIRQNKKMDWARMVTYSTAAHLTENARGRAVATGRSVPAPAVDWKWWKEPEEHSYKDTVPSEGSFLYRMVLARNKETGQPFNDRDVAAQCQTMMLAGYETTSMALSFCVYYLATHPECEEKLLAEIDAFGADKPLTMESLAHFTYTEAVLHETLRLLPPAPVFARGSMVECQIGDVIIPEGVDVHINTWGMHYNPDYFPEPEAFKPQRFLEPPTWPPHAYLPFGIGPRNCPGSKFAIEEARIALVKFYRRYTFRLCPEHHSKGPLQLRMGITLSPKEGLWVTAHPRAEAQRV